MKVCDGGTYTLKDSLGCTIKTLDGEYVPVALMPGRGPDYVDMKIDGTGKITNWKRFARLDDFFLVED